MFKLFKQTLLILIILLLSVFQSANAQFSEMYQGTDEYNPVTGMSFLNSTTGFVAFSKFIGYTEDGGKTFVKRSVSYANTNFNGYSVGLTFGFAAKGVVAFSATSLLVYGDFSFEPSILYSSDGGQSWLLVFHRNINLNAPRFSDGITDMKFPGGGQTGYAVHHEQVLKTTNGGQTWAAVLNAPVESLRRISAPSASSLYVSGGEKVYKSTNGGASWSSVTPVTGNSYKNFNNVFFLNATTGYCTDQATFQLFKTIDGASSWTKVNDPELVPVYANDIWYTGESTGYIASGAFDVLKTSDGGRIWEKCKKDKPYQYLNYGMERIWFLDASTAWAGGNREYLLKTSNAGEPTLPKAVFRIDTTNFIANQKVDLQNHSKSGYTYRWFKNGIEISTGYNFSYQHESSVSRDVIRLIVSNGTDSDTLDKTIDFSAPIQITSFSPEVGYKDAGVVIKGKDFYSITSVTFGGVPAWFQHRSDTEIFAYVGNGASGEVRVSSATASGSRPGFVFLEEPKLNMPVSVVDTMLCKSEKAVILIAQSEPDVVYELKNADNVSFGAAKGNGGGLQLTTREIAVSGYYTLWATRTYNSTGYITRQFQTPLHIVVEHTRSVFAADKVNVLPNEQVSFSNYSIDATTFRWTFNEDASISTSGLPVVNGVSYAAAGQKTFQLISESDYGCKDTIGGNTVFVYNKPATDDNCYANNTPDDDSYEVTGTVVDMSPDKNNGFLVCGWGTNPTLKSRYGNGVTLKETVGTLARYTVDGVLKWVHHIPGGYINSSITDKDGNIFVAGYSWAGSYYYFNNGDSMTMVPNSATTHPGYSKWGGFIMKLDPQGKYLWHTLLIDPSPRYQGYPVAGGNIVKMRLKDDQLIVIGTCIANMSYYENGNVTPIMSYRNSGYENENMNNFVVSIGLDGKYKWSVTAHNESNNHRRAFSDLVIDDAGNSYLSGYYEYAVELWDAAGTSYKFYGATGSSLSYIIKINKQGRFVWNTRWSGTHSGIYSLGLDAAGNLYATGSTTKGTGTITHADNTTHNFSYGGFMLAKMSPEGKTIWTQGSKYAYYGQGNVLHVDGNDIYVAGGISQNGEQVSDFILTSAGGDVPLRIYENEFFLARYNSDGAMQKLQTSGKNDGGHVVVSRLFSDAAHNLYLGGNIDQWNGGSGNYGIFGIPIITRGHDGFYARLDPVACTIATLPGKPFAGKDTTICQGTEASLLATVAAGLAPVWSSDDGFSSQSAGLTVKPVRSSNYYLSVRSASGEIARDTVMVSVLPVTADAGADKTVCEHALDSVGVKVSGDTYTWTSRPAGFSSTQASPYIYPASDTEYFLAVKTPAGCMAYDTVMISVKPVPQKPAVTKDEQGFLVSSAEDGNQWFYANGNAVPGENRRRFKPAVDGFYAVRATLNDCEGPKSDLFEYKAPVVTGIDDLDGVNTLAVIYPNPARDAFRVRFQIFGVQQLNLSVHDSRGRLVLTKKQVRNGDLINISSLAQGFYILRLTDNRNKVNVILSLVKN
ncbi:MAG: T9SS type A sorting domain-containing protein [Pseudobacter sp.]|uniref:T9SS type A sorting domain-containing protein n=1 Tax=Pseudobacter sp. TaxID=2045420 RepID=UPI003F7D41B3